MIEQGLVRQEDIDRAHDNDEDESEYTIGDYYDRKDRERKAAHAKWMEAMKKYDADPSYANEEAKYDAYEAMIDAGNTGD